MDENVHFCNTLELIKQLVEKNKPYHLQVRICSVAGFS